MPCELIICLFQMQSSKIHAIVLYLTSPMVVKLNRVLIQQLVVQAVCFSLDNELDASTC